MSNEELVKLYQEGNKQALDSLFDKNKGIVMKVVNKFYLEKNASVTVEDLEQEAWIALITAADKYDAKNIKNASFITFASNTIYYHLYKVVVGHSTTNKGNRKFNNSYSSLNIKLGGESESEVEAIDIIECENNNIDTMINGLYLNDLKKAIKQAMNEFTTPRDQRILESLYGLNNRGNTLSTREISKKLNLSYQRINKIKLDGVKKLSQSDILRKYLEDM